MSSTKEYIEDTLIGTYYYGEFYVKDPSLEELLTLKHIINKELKEKGW